MTHVQPGRTARMRRQAAAQDRRDNPNLPARAKRAKMHVGRGRKAGLTNG